MDPSHANVVRIVLTLAFSAKKLTTGPISSITSPETRLLLKSSLLRKLTALLLCASLFLLPKPAHADTLKTDATEIIVAAVAIGAAIGIGIYFLVRQPPTLHGCVSSAPNSLILLNEGDQQPYDLIGDTAGVKVGERVKVSGKKKKDSSGKRYFLVEKLSKDYGACKVLPATP
jgi:hypothetical protein